MTRRTNPIDERFEHLLREQASAPAPDVMSGLVRELRQAYVAPLPMEVQNRQISDLIVAGRQATTSRPSPFRRRVNGVWYRFSQRFIAGSVVGKVVLAASIATAATTGMAATGRLPDPMQIAFSAAAAQIGVSIPGPSAQFTEASRPPQPPAPNRSRPLQVPPAGPGQPRPAPVAATSSQPQPAPTAQPAGACDRAMLASTPAPPDPGDVLNTVKGVTEEQLKLDELLKCLVPGPAPPPPSNPGDGSGGLEELLHDLLGGP